MEEWKRRGFLKAVVVSAAAPACSSEDDPLPDESVPEPSDPAARDLVFPQGLASGDPRPDGVLLWTRAAPPAPTAEVSVRWFIARDESFTDLVTSGLVLCDSETDHTVRVRLTELEPATSYYYRFSVETTPGVVTTTETGRTKTAPEPSADLAVRIAVASCQEYVGRWYHAWREMADEPEPIDFVLFLGDYIYETVADPIYQPLDTERGLTIPDGLSLDGSAENVAAVTLADYRALYRQYRSDPDLRRAHAKFPFVLLWDDHEFTNDGWQDVANEFNGERGVERDTLRRAAATRAWFEYLPVDLSYEAGAAFPGDIRTWRTMRYGRHVELFLSDVRYFRDDHVVPEDESAPSVGKFMANSVIGSRVFALKEGFDVLEAQVAPTMLGDEQREALITGVQSTDATWKIWGSPLMVSQMVLDLREVEEAPPLLRNAFYFKVDQWDGFRTERAELLTAFSDVANFVVFSGDLHGNYVSELRVDFDEVSSVPMGTEFTVTGVSSIALQEQLEIAARTEPILQAAGLDQVLEQFDDTLLESGPHFSYANSAAYGYAIAEINALEMRVRYVEIDSVTDSSVYNRTTKRWVLESGKTRPLSLD